MENNKTEKTCKLIFNAGTARSLLRSGCVIADIKQSRENPDKTIFAFVNDEHFKIEFERINKEIAAARAAQKGISE